MLKAKPPSPFPYLLSTIALIVAGHWWFNQHSQKTPDSIILPQNSPSVVLPPFPSPTTVPSGTVVDIDGSTSMVTINQRLKRAFEQHFPDTKVETQANGSNQGIQSLLTGRIDIAAISRPLNEAETRKGLQAVKVTNDAIAIVVSINNPFKGNLTAQQVQGIFQGTIVNWSQVGGPNKIIRVLNRPAVSGTHQAFQDLVLQGGQFGISTNITTLPEDATTPLLRALGEDGIGYATDQQVMTQKTVRVVPVNNSRPGQPNYPYRRTLYYAYENPASEVAKAFLGFALSPPGQQAFRQEP